MELSMRMRCLSAKEEFCGRDVCFVIRWRERGCEERLCAPSGGQSARLTKGGASAFVTARYAAGACLSKGSVRLVLTLLVLLESSFGIRGPTFFSAGL